MTPEELKKFIAPAPGRLPPRFKPLPILKRPLLQEDRAGSVEVKIGVKFEF